MTREVNVDLNSFVGWVNEKPQSRVASIEIKMRTPYPSVEVIAKQATETKIWVYDHELAIGQFVKSTDEIDLERRKEDKEKSLLAQLKKKYEGGDAA